MGENKCWFGNKLKNRKNYFYGSYVFMKKEYTNPHKSGVFTPENDRGWD